jgi:hypothetical protein
LHACEQWKGHQHEHVLPDSSRACRPASAVQEVVIEEMSVNENENANVQGHLILNENANVQGHLILNENANVQGQLILNENVNESVDVDVDVSACYHRALLV